MAATAPPINYAPAPKGIRYHWVRRLTALALLIVLCAVAIRYVPRMNRRLDLLRCQGLAMTYAAPADHVVYERDPAKAAALLRSSPNYWAVNYPSEDGPIPLPSHTLAGLGVVVDFVPEWRDFYRLASPPGRNTGAVLFLHKLRSPAGHERLVAVDGFLSAGSARLRLARSVFTPAMLFSRPQFVTDDARFSLAELGELQAERVFAGQLDPADPSHFSILYETATGTGVIDGWLKDDDSVKLEQHTP
ncbi:MAG: hypothetical protein JWL69_4383 [Phycisphaerales bacterium]|nr:hypothetical protein [Phycisphaerales bacterium]MDB5355060.1 hypothetical protein [Phycisphaerales bacterium]